MLTEAFKRRIPIVILSPEEIDVDIVQKIHKKKMFAHIDLLSNKGPEL